MQLLPSLGAIGVVVSLCLPAAAQTQLAFPMDVVDPDPVTAYPRLQTRVAELRELAELDAVVLRGFPLAGGTTLDLALERIDLSKREFRFRVDGAAAPDLLAGLELSVWTGAVVGSPGSDVMLSFSNRGTRGWVRSASALHHVMPQPAEDGDWARGTSLVVRERDLEDLGLSLGEFCATDRLAGAGFAPPPASPQAPSVGGPGAQSGAGSTAATAAGPTGPAYECRIAVETDYQLFGLFSDLGAETAYVTSLLAAISARFEEQVDTVLTYPYVQFYTSPNDPWSTPDLGGDTIAMLGEFQNAWSGQVPGGALLGHFISGAALGGGVGYVGAICDTSQNFTFSVSANINTLAQVPVVQSPFTWDFIVFSHESGHNFGSPHTHDYVPPIDSCAFGACITNGTLMSYCHTCPGGVLNMYPYFFEPTVPDTMSLFTKSCLPPWGFEDWDPAHAPKLAVPGGAAPFCQPELGFAGPGALELTVCGQPLSSGNSAEVLLSGAAANKLVWLIASTGANPTPFAGGTIVPQPIQSLTIGATDATGRWSLPLAGGGGPLTLNLQAAVIDPSLPGWLQISGAVAVDYLP